MQAIQVWRVRVLDPQDRPVTDTDDAGAIVGLATETDGLFEPTDEPGLYLADVPAGAVLPVGYGDYELTWTPTAEDCSADSLSKYLAELH